MLRSDNDIVEVLENHQSEREKGKMVGERSYIAIRREDGKPDFPTHFGPDVSVIEMIRWCQHEGYTVLRHEIVPTPKDTKHMATVIITVRRYATNETTANRGSTL